MLRALRNVFAMQSVTPEAVSNIMRKVRCLCSVYSLSAFVQERCGHRPQAAI